MKGFIMVKLTTNIANSINGVFKGGCMLLMY